MARDQTQDYYYVPLTVNGVTNYVFNSSIQGPSVSSFTLFVGIRLQKMLLSQQDLFQELGFLNRETLNNQVLSNTPYPTVLNLSDQGDAMRASVIKRVNFSLIRADLNGPVAPSIGEVYNTYIHYPGTTPTYAIENLLYSRTFSFDGILYRIRPLSIKEYRSRATLPSSLGIGVPPFGALGGPTTSQPSSPIRPTPGGNSTDSPSGPGGGTNTP